MFIGFSKSLKRLGGFRVGFRKRLKGWNLLLMLIPIAIYYMMYYLFIAMFWMMYGMFWLLYKIVRCIFVLPIMALCKYIADKNKSEQL
mgnify:FL=1